MSLTQASPFHALRAALLTTLIGITFAPLIASAQSGAPLPAPEIACADAGGTWDILMETLCAPCNPCVDSDGELREDGALPSCLATCEPWCSCPNGLTFNGVACVANDQYRACQDELPEAQACLETGGDWTFSGGCDDYTCSSCLDESGERVQEFCNEIGCPAFGCACPEGKIATEDGCKPYAEVLSACEDTPEGGTESPAGGAESPVGGTDAPMGGTVSDAQTVEEGGCDQLSGRSASIWLLCLLLALTPRRALYRA